MAWEYKFNIPGPDITGLELAGLMDRVPATRQLVMNGHQLQRSLHRISAQAESRCDCRDQDGKREERHHFRALLGRSLARSCRRYRQERICLRPWRRSTSHRKKTKEFFDTQKRLATEHAVLEDTGKGSGRGGYRKRPPILTPAKGRLASTFALVRLGANAAAAKDPSQESTARPERSDRNGYR